MTTLAEHEERWHRTEHRGAPEWSRQNRDHTSTHTATVEHRGVPYQAKDYAIGDVLVLRSSVSVELSR